MPNSDYAEKKKFRDYISWGHASYIVTVVAACCAGLLVIWRSQATQDKEIAQNGKNITAVSTELKGEVKRSTEAYQRFDRTLTNHGHILADTRETLSGVQAMQQAIKEENGRLTKSIEHLADELRKNGRDP